MTHNVHLKLKNNVNNNTYNKFMYINLLIKLLSVYKLDSGISKPKALRQCFRVQPIIC